MATGFMASVGRVMRHCMALSLACLSLAVGAQSNAAVSGVSVAGVFPGKALLVVKGGEPRAVPVGSTLDGVKVLAIDGEQVTLEIDGQRRALRVGQHVVSQKASDDRQETTLIADARGHYVTNGTVNGRPVRFLVDTGATMVSLGVSDATRLGIDPRKGEPGYSQTANGKARVWKVKLDSVQVGNITVHGVDGLIHESEMPVALLGMSFLSRMEIRNEGSSMQLKKRY